MNNRLVPIIELFAAFDDKFLIRVLAHDVRETAILVDDVTGNAGGQVGQQEGGGVADFLDGYIATQWRMFGDEVQQDAEIFDPTGSQCLDRASRNAVDADSFFAE